MKVIGIVGSARRGGNTATLVQKVRDHARTEPMMDHASTVKAIFFDLGDTLINSRIFGPNGAVLRCRGHLRRRKHKKA